MICQDCFSLPFCLKYCCANIKERNTHMNAIIKLLNLEDDNLSSKYEVNDEFNFAPARKRNTDLT